MRILCVDDDRTTLTLICRSLEKACPEDEILTASSGEEAIEQLKSGDIDLLITDLIMPGISGIEVLEKAKLERLETEVIMVTAFSSVETAVEAMQKGARDYLPKPINIELLVEKVENLKEFLQSRREVDDYRYAMSVIEEDISRTAQMVEKRLDEMRARLDSIRETLDAPLSKEEKLTLIAEKLGVAEELKAT